ncbi:hypothetical protein OIO90_006375 [Microbotryomycetes sp. JL221]|nr:hypothetical protein OIO90_006375 [Microbotryomycetes sp. JL221]
MTLDAINNASPPSQQQSPHHQQRQQQQQQQYESFQDLTAPSTFASDSVQHHRHSTRQHASDAILPTGQDRASRSGIGRRRSRAHSSFFSKLWRTKARDKHDEDARGINSEQEQEDDDDNPTTNLSSWNMMALTLGLAGAQLTWTIEMAFGTPYLLNLGLSKTSTSLVWLAGPLSGLIVQPLIGAISDSSQSRYRRRAFIASSALFVIISTLFVAYAKELAMVISSMTGVGDWDPQQQDRTKSISIFIGVVGFYVLDFSLNGLQATLRALILDRSPAHQQPVANAWHGRMTHLGNIFGYMAGYIDLGHARIFHWIGGSQFRKLAVMSCFFMVLCVTVTCWTQKEKQRLDAPNGVGVQWSQAWQNVKQTIKHLPIPVRQVCVVQFCAWSSWFPFLFYSTSYVTEVLYSTIPPDQDLPSTDTATRAGSLALLLYAIVAFSAGTILPLLTTLGYRPLINRRISRHSTKGRFLRRLLTLLSLRNMWTMGLLMFSFGILMTFWVRDVRGATFVIAFLGVPWAINSWIPFALVMECVRDMTPKEPQMIRSSHSQQSSTTESRANNLLPSSPNSPTIGRHSSTNRTYDSSTSTFNTNQSRQQRPQPKNDRPFRSSINRQSSLLDTSAGYSEHESVVNGCEGGRQSTKQALSECSPLLSDRLIKSNHQLDQQKQRQQNRSRLSMRPNPTEQVETNAGATILGIHNLSIVAPQFLVAIVASLIFKFLDKSTSTFELINMITNLITYDGNGENHEGEEGGGGARDQLRNMNDVVWVLRFGGLVSLIGAWVSRWLIETSSEKTYKEYVLSWFDPFGENDREEHESTQDE